MARGKHGPRLPFHSGGAPATISIEVAQWERLQAAWGVVLSSTQQDHIVSLCNQHLMFREAEGAATWSDVKNLFLEAQKASAAFARLAWGELTPHTDEGAQLETLFESALKNYPATFKGADGNVEFRVLTKHDISEIAGSLVCAMKAVRKEIDSKIAEGRGGFMPGDAFREWLIQMKKWAKAEKLTFGPYENDGSASRFSNFLFQLHNLFPKPLQEELSSASAVAERLKKSNRGKLRPK